MVSVMNLQLIRLLLLVVSSKTHDLSQFYYPNNTSRPSTFPGKVLPRAGYGSEIQVCVSYERSMGSLCTYIDKRCDWLLKTMKNNKAIEMQFLKNES